MAGDPTRVCALIAEQLLEHPNGLTLSNLSERIDRKENGVSQMLRRLASMGFVEKIKTSQKGARGRVPYIWRLGPRIRSKTIDAGQSFRVELVGDDPQSGREARPTNPQGRLS